MCGDGKAEAIWRMLVSIILGAQYSSTKTEVIASHSYFFLYLLQQWNYYHYILTHIIALPRLPLAFLSHQSLGAGGINSSAVFGAGFPHSVQNYYTLCLFYLLFMPNLYVTSLYVPHTQSSIISANFPCAMCLSSMSSSSI